MRITNRTIAEFTFRFWHKMSENYGGERTVNELRVLNAVLGCNLKKNSVSCSWGTTQIAKHLGIPKSTVSRAVYNLVQKGWLREKPHPEDRRRRIVLLGPNAVEHRKADWQEFCDWIVAHSE